MTDSIKNFKARQVVLGWLVHLFTASGAVLGLFTLLAIHESKWLLSFWFMASAVLVDAVDGTFARMVRVREVASRIDGALLDNIVDYLNYVVAPAFFLALSDLIPASGRWPIAALVVLVSAYQFTQKDAKTADHFFKGFPSYWNIVVFYLFLWQMPPVYNAAIVVGLAILVFVPIKYIYPSRLEYLCESAFLRKLVFAATLLWGACTIWLLWIFPAGHEALVGYSCAYIIFYILLSIHLTLTPGRIVPANGEESLAA